MRGKLNTAASASRREGVTDKDSYIFNAIAGKQMYKDITNEKSKHFIGERIKLKRDHYKTEKEECVDGYVTGIYQHFLLLKCYAKDGSTYNTSISYKDLIMGGF